MDDKTLKILNELDPEVHKCNYHNMYFSVNSKEYVPTCVCPGKTNNYVSARGSYCSQQNCMSSYLIWKGNLSNEH